ncbi:RagB/SusD family nutrient uptake outer membrane protein [Tamlana fucoidanivorans]|uniref:RagB/SusD family nutrient uptake outer membrane protein n=1 Tax=Allotamlana fucoidanivorans TaxID=2583814 RepID=A0A5C4SND6_9FLAO|nr:RagB/SusD family nutrient uptake outer membrane protein [Tamlana fucoidanivorans]TNJ45628.1 RagB/SusD family nutrient uptake outer membrane protein [Tamlana fucoidanivorans]
MKRLKLKISLVVILGITISACKEEFLEEFPVGRVTEETLADEQGVNLLLIGAYSVIDGFSQGGPGGAGEASATNWVWGDVPSDDMHRGDQTGGWSAINLIERYEVDPTNPWVEGLWAANYDGVSRANDVLRVLKLAGDAIPDNSAKQLEAEARWLRAWFHFQLRSKIERIPYITENVKASEVPNDREVWDDIEADLQWGIDNGMAEVPSEVGRASRWAAKALKARVHMFQKEFSEAKPLLDDIINNGPFVLMDHFYDNHDEEKQNNAESIFEVQYTVNDGTGGGENAGSDHRTLFPRGADVGLCCAYSAPSFDLFNAFKVDANGLPLLDTFQDDLLLEDYGLLDTQPFTPTDVELDPRVDWTIGRRGIPFLDWGPMSGGDWMLDQAGMGPFLNKKIMFYKRNFKTISIATPTWSAGLNGNNWRLFRLSHVILWRAEVAAEENDLIKARDMVNMIRERAQDDIVMGKISNTTFGAGEPIIIDENEPAANYNLGLYASFPDKNYALKAVRHEMRLEFALEGMRFQDLVRWEIDGDVIPKYLQSELSNGKLPWIQGANYTPGQDDYFPLPQSQLDLQRGVLEQDPNY